MNKIVFLALIQKEIEKVMSSLEIPRGEVGDRGPRGPEGKEGKSFIFEEHEDKITSIVKSHLPTEVSITEEQLLALKGERGRDGRDGKDFSFEENKSQIHATLNSILDEMKDSLKLKFSDLSEEEVAGLKGAKGRDGKDGKDFSFEENKSQIHATLNSILDEMKESLKLKFSDLSEEEVAGLKGAKGRDGKDGRDFSFDESREEIQAVLTSIVEGLRDDYKLKFSDLTESEVDSLKLKFESLTFEQKQELKGARGQRGKEGSRGPEGKSAFNLAQEAGFEGTESDWIASLKGPQGDRGEKGEQGPRGIRGVPGVVGPRGFTGDQGPRGKDAPKIESVQALSRAGSLRFEFELSNGQRLETPSVKLPQAESYFIPQPQISVGLRKAVLRDSSVYKGAAVLLENKVAKLASAKSLSTSCVIGIVERVYEEFCDIRVFGETEESIAGILIGDLYLSNEVDGGLIPTPPITSGHVRLRVGQSITEGKIIFMRGDATLIV